MYQQNKVPYIKLLYIIPTAYQSNVNQRNKVTYPQSIIVLEYQPGLNKSFLSFERLRVGRICILYVDVQKK